MKSPRPTSHPDSSSSGRLRTRSRERRAIRYGMGISLLLHFLFLAVYPLLMDRLEPPAAPGERSPEAPEPMGTEIVLLLEIPPEEEPEPPEEDPEIVPEDPDLPAPVRPVPPVVEPGAPLPGDEEEEDEEEEERRRATAAERLQPTMGDPRLWAPLDERYTGLSDEERAELLLRGMIRSWNDSVAVAAALSGRATDWTYTDDEGRRWGLSPGRLHLGDFSIPLPFSFEMSPSQRAQQSRRQWEIDDILRGAAAAEIRETWAERAREIRERMERERGGGG